MKKLFMISFLMISQKVFAYDQQPPFENKDTSVSENFRNSYYNIDDLDRRTVKYKDLSRVINVKDYGAVGDGSVDDSAAFAAAIADAVSIAGNFNSIIYAPPGVYRVAINVGAQNVSFEGEPGATFFLPISSSAFILNFTGIAQADRRYVNGIYFYGDGSTPFNGQTWPRGGRAVYINSLSFIEFENCQFQTLEYGIYSNGSEWNHIFNCHFVSCQRGYIATSKNNDVLGNNPLANQNSAASWFVQSDFWGNDISFYADDPDNGAGDHQAAFSFKQCEFLTSTSAVVAVYNKGSVATLYYPLSFDYCWFEGNGGDPVNQISKPFNGNTWRQGDIAVSGAQLSVDHIFFGGGYISLTNGAHFVAQDIHLAGSIEASTDTVAYGNNVLMDYQNGRILDWITIDNLSSFNPDRPAAARTHPHLGITRGNSYTNVISSGTSSCAKGFLPGISLGSPSISFFNDGLYVTTGCVRISGIENDTAAWTANVKAGKWYASTFSVRGSTSSNLSLTQSSTFTIVDNTGIIIPTQFPIRISPTWRTYGSIGTTPVTGSISLGFQLHTSTEIFISMFQIVEFPNEQEAKDFYNSNMFVLPLAEQP